MYVAILWSPFLHNDPSHFFYKWLLCVESNSFYHLQMKEKWKKKLIVLKVNVKVNHQLKKISKN